MVGFPPEQADGTVDESENSAIFAKDSKDPMRPEKRQFVYNRLEIPRVSKYFSHGLRDGLSLRLVYGKRCWNRYPDVFAVLSVWIRRICVPLSW